MCGKPGPEELYIYRKTIKERVLDILKDKNNIEVESNSWIERKLVDLIVERVNVSFEHGIGRGYQQAKEKREGPY